MGSVKRKSSDETPLNHTPQPHKQLKDDTNINNTPLATNNETDTGVACVHDVSYPENYVPAPRRSNTDQDSKPAKEFPFTLDPFQSEAINCLNVGESVMVTVLCYNLYKKLLTFLIVVGYRTCGIFVDCEIGGGYGSCLFIVNVCCYRCLRIRLLEKLLWRRMLLQCR